MKERLLKTKANGMQMLGVIIFMMIGSIALAIFGGSNVVEGHFGIYDAMILVAIIIFTVACIMIGGIKV